MDISHESPSPEKDLEVEGQQVSASFSWGLEDQEDENLRLLLQRDLRLKTSKIKDSHLIKGQAFNCNVTLSMGKNPLVDDCNDDFIAKRIVEKEMSKIDTKGLFERQGFKTAKSVSITLGSSY